MCQHQPRCPQSRAPDHLAARIAAAHPEQGWSLLCNGVIAFDDGGELLPDGRAVLPGPCPPLKARLIMPILAPRSYAADEFGVEQATPNQKLGS